MGCQVLLDVDGRMVMEECGEFSGFLWREYVDWWGNAGDCR